MTTWIQGVINLMRLAELMECTRSKGIFGALSKIYKWNSKLV
jgi:hypothetical protein